METNEVLLKLGHWGKWQIRNYVMLCFSVMIAPAWNSVAIVYVGYKPDHHCKVPDNIPLNQSIPTIDGKLSSCLMYKNYSVNDEVIPCNNGWTYLGDDGPTIVTKWDLVCDKSHLAGNTQMFFVLGSIFGSLFFANLSDRLGRKTIFLFVHWATVFFGCVSVFVPNFTAYCVIRFFLGAVSHSIIIVGFILTCESFASPNRTLVGTVIEGFWALALITLPLFAFLFKNWVHLLLFLHLCGLLSIPLYWLLPESLLWLEIKGRTDEAEKEIQKAARINKISIPSPIYTKKQLNEEKEKLKKKDLSFTIIKQKIKRVFSVEGQTKADEGKYIYTAKHLFVNKTLRKHMVLTSLLWLTVIMVYFGFLMSTGVLAGNHYINGALSGIMELPGYILSYFLMIRFGRRYPLIGFQFMAGVALICQVIMQKVDLGPNVNNKIFVIMFNMIGKFGMAGAYGSLDLYAPELFPTTLRNQAQGIASVFGRVGAIISSFLPFVLEKNDWIPLVVMAAMLVFGCLFVYLLPETVHRNLPNSIEDIEAWTIVVNPDDGRQNETTSVTSGNVIRRRKKNSEGTVVESVGAVNKAFTNDDESVDSTMNEEITSV